MRKDFGTAFRFVGLDGGRLVQVGSRATFSFGIFGSTLLSSPAFFSLLLYLVLQPV